MAAPATKRRKVEHSPSGAEDDEASFASFGESEEENDGGEQIEDVAEDIDLGGPESGDSAEDATDGANDSESEEEMDNSDVPIGKHTADLRGEQRYPTRNLSDQSRQQTTKGISKGRQSQGTTYTAGTFKGNTFKLQVDELLEQIRQRHGKREIKAEEALHKLKKTIDLIPARGPLSVDEAERQLLLSSKVVTPFPNPRPPKDAKYKLEYAKPSSINVVGSYALKTAIHSEELVVINLMVEMPASVFHEKDYLNYRYFSKRAFYLACIAAGLKEKHNQDFHINFRYSDDNPLKPVLVITPNQSPTENNTQSDKPGWHMNVLPCVSNDALSGDKLFPDKNCVRSQRDATTNPTDEIRRPTPFYNSSLRSDMLMASYLKFMHSTSKMCAAFRDACLLGSTWLRQRGFDSNISSGGFGNSEWSALIALLMQTGGLGGRPMLSESYSSYQLVKATLQLLATRDLNKQPLVLGQDGRTADFTSINGPVIWDGERKHNLLFKMPIWSYRLIRQEARTTISMLGDQQFDGFDATFISRTDGLLYRYETVVELSAPTIERNSPQGDHNMLVAYENLYEVLQRGLGDRISHISIIPTWSKTWSIQTAGQSLSAERKLQVGFIVNPDTVNRTIDHGPSAEEKAQAASFRRFWGEKAELRRFKDGSIIECLVWSSKDSVQPIIEQIIRFLIGKHFGDEAEQGMKYIGEGFTRMLGKGGTMADFHDHMAAFKQLESDIRSLDGLPLSIRQIMPADAQLRNASVDIPATGRRKMPADVTIQFEGSARWPDDLVAIQRTKIAFLLKLSELLQESVESTSARIGLENGGHDILNQVFLDVIYDSGAAFRLRIHHDREQALLERMLKDKLLDPRSKEIAAIGLANFKRDYSKTPSLTQTIARLCSRHAALSGTIRLTKKWFASHLLSNHVAEETVELIVARSFVQSWPWKPPASVQTGFLRTLFWLSRWDWRAEPLILDLSGSGELKKSDLDSIETKFEAWRKIDPALNRVVLFAASNVDHDGTTWTAGRPAKVVAGRMTALAKAACAEAEEKQLGLDPHTLFASPLSDFDFIIHLNPKAVRRKPRRKHSRENGVAFKNLELDFGDDDDSLAECDIMRDYAQELESLYGSAILFFSGGQEQPIIAGLWNPQTAPRPWKLNLAYSATPRKQSSEQEVQAEINKDSILAEIARMGGDMVQKIELNNP